jgi:pentatricopeptide repeat protein
MQNAPVKPDVRVYGKLIASYARSRQTEQAFAALDLMRAHGLHPNLRVITALLPVCTMATVESVFDHIRRHDLRPDRVFLVGTLELYARSHATDKLLELLRIMEPEFKVAPDVHIFNVALQGCVSAEDLTAGWRVREMMREFKVAPDRASIVQLIALCSQKQLRWDQQRQAWGRDERQRPHPYAQPDPQQELMDRWLSDVFSDMRRHRIVPDQAIFTALMTFNSLDIERAWGLFQVMHDAVPHPHHTLVSVVCSRVCVCGVCGAENTASQNRQGVANEVAYNVLLKRCRDLAECDRGLALWKTMQASGVLPSSSTFALLLQLCGRTPDAAMGAAHAQRVWNSVVRGHGRQPDHGHLGALLYAYGRTGDVDTALALLDDAKLRHGLAPIEDTFTSLLDGLTAHNNNNNNSNANDDDDDDDDNEVDGDGEGEERDRQYEACLRVMRRAEAEGVTPGMQKVKYTFKMSMRRDRFDEAEWLLGCMRRKGLPDAAHQSFAASLASAKAAAVGLVTM